MHILKKLDHLRIEWNISFGMINKFDISILFQENYPSAIDLSRSLAKVKKSYSTETLLVN